MNSSASSRKGAELYSIHFPLLLYNCDVNTHKSILQCWLWSLWSVILVPGFLKAPWLRPSSPDPFGCREHTLPALTAFATQTELLQPKLNPEVMATKPCIPSIYIYMEVDSANRQGSYVKPALRIAVHECICVGTDPPTHHHGNVLMANTY